jgi:hypothetical protein
MKHKSRFTLARLFGIAAACACVAMPELAFGEAAPPLVMLRTRAATFCIDGAGTLCALSRDSDSRSYLASHQPAPLLSVRAGGRLYPPDSAAWDLQAKRLTLQFTDAGVSAVLAAEAKPTHVVFEVLDIQPANRAELVLWGPYPTTIGDIIGEVVGVVRDAEFAVGIQALNAKTLGGYPANENDIKADYTADDPGHYANLPAELNKDQLYRGDTARRTEFGSVLQACCRDRSRSRIIANWGHEKFLAPAYADGGVIGSRIALFACPAPQALETIGAIEVAEGLPHPMLDGASAKIAGHANCSYLIPQADRPEYRRPRRRIDPLRLGVGEGAVAAARVSARRLGDAGLGARGRRGRGQADGSRVQGLPHRCRSHAGSRAEHRQTLQPRGHAPDFARRLGGQLVHRHGTVWADTLHPGLV